MSSRNSNTTSPADPPPHVPTSPLPPSGPDPHTQFDISRPSPSTTTTTFLTPLDQVNPQTATTSLTSRDADFVRFAHYFAISCLIAVPVIIALPPRKLDFYTLTLLAGGVISGNHLVKERYQTGLLGLVGQKLGLDKNDPRNRALALGARDDNDDEGRFLTAMHRAEERAESLVQRFDLPTEKSRSVHDAIIGLEEGVRLREEGRGYLMQEAERLRATGWGYGGDMARMLAVARGSAGEDGDSEGGKALDAVESGERRRRQALASASGAAEDTAHESDGGVKAMAKKVWYGGEDSEHWKEQRMKEEREALEEGKGYGGMILEQIWEVWNWDKRKDEDGEWVPKKEYEAKYRQ